MSIMNRSSTREMQVHTEAAEGFPARVRSLLLEVADRKGTATHGPWEDGSGEPLQSDAEAALRWIEVHAADTGGAAGHTVQPPHGLVQLAERVAGLNASSGEIGPVMLAQLVQQASAALAVHRPTI